MEGACALISGACECVAFVARNSADRIKAGTLRGIIMDYPDGPSGITRALNSGSEDF